MREGREGVERGRETEKGEMCREPGVEGEGGWEKEEGIGTGKEANGGVSCGQLTGVQGHSMGQRRIKEAGCQGIGAAAVCALLRGRGGGGRWGRQSPVLWGNGRTSPQKPRLLLTPFGPGRHWSGG